MLCSRLTVEFSPPWWVGTLERWEDGRYEVGRVVFGAEPTEPEVLLWVLHRLSRLRTTPAMEAPARRPEAQNPKRRQRQIAREQQRPAGKKAWAAVRQRDGKPKSKHAVSRRQRSAGRQPGNSTGCTGRSGSRSTGDTEPRLPGCAQHPGGDDPCRGVFYLLRKNLQSPACTSAPKPV